MPRVFSRQYQRCQHRQRKLLHFQKILHFVVFVVSLSHRPSFNLILLRQQQSLLNENQQNRNIKEKTKKNSSNVLRVIRNSFWSKKKENRVIILTMGNDYYLCISFKARFSVSTLSIKWTIKVIDDRFNIFSVFINQGGTPTQSSATLFLS